MLTVLIFIAITSIVILISFRIYVEGEVRGTDWLLLGTLFTLVVACHQSKEEEQKQEPESTQSNLRLKI